MTKGADFLSEGAKSYIDALAAVDAFEKNVQSVCREVYEKYKTQLASTMGLENDACEDHEYKDPANRFAEIGVLQSSPSERESLYIYVMWDGAPDISACVSLEFSKKSDRNDAYRRLRRNPACSIEPNDDSPYPGLWSRKTQNDPSAWAETLDALLNEWLGCWPAGWRLK